MKAETALRHALAANLADADVSATIGTIRGRPWASATFAGTRFEFELRLSDTKVDVFLADLPEREFKLPGHILIDIAAAETGRDGEERILAVEALTIEAD